MITTDRLTLGNRFGRALAAGLTCIFLGAAMAGAHGLGGKEHAHIQGAGLNQPSATFEQIETVRLVIITHLDVGFTGGAVDVINYYFEQYFPTAIDVAETLARSPRKDLRDMGYKVTTYPWLLSLYLDCPQDLIPSLACPSPADVGAVKNAIKNGVITWQGYASNLQAELMDPSLYRFALQMAHTLDQRFHKTPTATLSLSDVPGTSRAILPLMHEEGYRALVLSANPAVVSAAVPNAFLWRNGPGGTDALAMVHSGGSTYGGIKLQDCIAVDGLKEALCVWFIPDNGPPPDVSAVRTTYRMLTKQFPKAKVRAATFDDFLPALEGIRSRLPVVDLDIGDTWINGPPADPLKLAMFREMSRARAECIMGGRCPADDPDIFNFSRLLLKAPEHTAGLGSGNIPDNNWSNSEFEQVRSGSAFQQIEGSWTEQRQFLVWALKALQRPEASASAKALHQEISARLAALEPSRPSTQGFREVTAPEGPFSCGAVEIGFDAATGAIVHLVDRRNGRQWAGNLPSPPEPQPFLHFQRMKLEADLRSGRESELDFELLAVPPPVNSGNPLALFLYRTYDALESYSNMRQYSYVWPPYFPSSDMSVFYKPEVRSAHPQSRWWFPKRSGTWRRDGVEGCEFLHKLEMPPQAHARYGAPESAWVRVVVPPDRAVVNIDFQWFCKTATRLPEALWMVFRPIAPDAAGWRLQTLDELLPPQHVAVNGSRHLAAVWEGASYCDDKGHLLIETLDATVVSPGFPALLDYNNQPVNPQDGMFFNLANNVWNTNWPLWYPWLAKDADSRFRFTLHLEKGCEGGRRRAAVRP